MWRWSNRARFVHARALSWRPSWSPTEHMCACMVAVTRSGAASNPLERAGAKSQAKAVDLQCAAAESQIQNPNFAFSTARRFRTAVLDAGTAKSGPLPPQPHSVGQRLASNVDVPKQRTLAWPDTCLVVGVGHCLVHCPPPPSPSPSLSPPYASSSRVQASAAVAGETLDQHDASIAFYISKHHAQIFQRHIASTYTLWPEGTASWQR